MRAPICTQNISAQANGESGLRPEVPTAYWGTLLSGVSIKSPLKIAQQHFL
jgi:hypothetical protein